MPWDEEVKSDVGGEKSPSSPIFEFKEAEVSDKLVLTIFGEKGSGKTCTAMGLPGTKAVLCFDNKAQLNKKHFFNNNESIKVYNTTLYLSKEPDKYQETAVMTYSYLLFLLDKISENKPNWIIIDGLEILSSVAEQIMRKNYGIKPYQGIPNMGIWKERRQILDSVHRKSIGIAKSGVVYTTYCTEDKIVHDGDVIELKKIPKWVDSVLYETDITLHVDSEFRKDGTKITAKVFNSKIPSFLKTGDTLNLTNKKLSDYISIG